MTISDTAASLTEKGQQTMMAIGRRELSFFDDGVVAGSGIWGSCLASEMGHKSSGVINRLRDAGLFKVYDGDAQDDSMWWELTELGADVANYLAAQDRADYGANPADAFAKDFPALAIPVVTAKVGSKWTYLYLGDTLIAEIATAHKDLIASFLAR
jgi:hypothetical protein